ncbi:unnamed protein product (mitochondrion) [Plasmodiophora brassicae]|uniref:Uncharacterized protein n=1 Tax=Plasmodiophora brassicae TaxID=37360 RepID=A0A0G4IQM5_PLABS|nr:hypothetical protein PBRA_000819 [Plasmodiophora brassicae]SPQ97786.1 unnamed protein product [Plasmodiophora brassicae]
MSEVSRPAKPKPKPTLYRHRSAKATREVKDTAHEYDDMLGVKDTAHECDDMLSVKDTAHECDDMLSVKDTAHEYDDMLSVKDTAHEYVNSFKKVNNVYPCRTVNVMGEVKDMAAKPKFEPAVYPCRSMNVMGKVKDTADEYDDGFKKMQSKAMFRVISEDLASQLKNRLDLFNLQSELTAHNDLIMEIGPNGEKPDVDLL